MTLQGVQLQSQKGDYQKDCRLTEVDPRLEEEDAEAEAQLKQGAEAPLQVKLNIEQHA